MLYTSRLAQWSSSSTSRLSQRALFSTCRRLSSDKQAISKTPLYELHKEHGATMVPFAGYSMPLLYKGQSHTESHNWVRSHAGLFDVSHMVQHKFSGPKIVQFLERITPSDLSELAPFSSTLSTFLRPTGGIVDDTIITKHSDSEFYVVTNAGCRDKDLEYFKSEMEKFQYADSINHHVYQDWGLIALQGPKSAETLQKLTSFDLANLKFGNSAFIDYKTSTDNFKLHTARGGYTGEDGFEIAIPPEQTTSFTTALLNAGQEDVKLAGLAARDSLRLEAGMCLYGHDIDESTTPVEASLSWIIGKRQRQEKGFYGADTILNQLSNLKTLTKRRVGLIVEGPPAREKASILSNDTQQQKQLGKVTSGCPSPTLGKNIAMGYVPSGSHKSGTQVQVQVRGKLHPAIITKMPFVPTNYYK